MAGINFNYYKTKQYKTNLITVSFIEKLDKDNVTANALLLKVLPRGCKKYPSMQDLQIALDGMYGASMSCGISKKGDCQSLDFSFSYPANQYVGDDVTTIITQLINELLFKPLLEGGAFKKEYVDQEKVNLIAHIEGRKNDKRIYSINRCAEKLFEGSVAGICEYGYSDKVSEITPEHLYARYKELLANAEVCVFLAGDFNRSNRETVFDIIEEYWMSVLGAGTSYHINKIPELNICGDVYVGQSDEVREYIEKMDVKQGKLAMGFSTGINLNSDEGIVLRVVNSIFGGGMHSKLFNVVREEKSLAYYASSMLEPFKGVILAASGIEFKNKELVADLMVEQLMEIQKGNISEYEFDSAKKSLINSYKSMLDSCYNMAQFELNRYIRNSAHTIDYLIEAVSNVTIDEVIAVSKKIRPDTIFFIDGKEA